MSKRLILILTLAFVAGIAFAAYAEVQNVKVSGDLLFRGIAREGFTLNKEAKYKVSGLTSTARLRVDADLTDNVSTTVRLLNERSWGGSFESGTIAGVTLGTSELSDDINIDLAYVTLKEFLYSPLALTVGRQELRFGNALIIGDPDTNLIAEEWAVPGDLSAKKAFDAIRATLTYDPLVVDLIYSKISENDIWYAVSGVSERVDEDLYGINGRYDLSGAGIKGAAEVYYFARVDRLPVHDADTQNKDICHTMGLLVSGEIITNLSGSLEYARQFGRIQYHPMSDDNYVINAKRSAWALQTALNYARPMRMSPNIGLVYTYLSGDKDAENNKYTAWDPMFEDQVLNSIPNALFPNSNCQVINVKASIKPMEDVTLSGVYGYYRLVKNMNFTDLYAPYGPDDGYYDMTTKKSLGHALDLTATYDYTEDVQLGLDFGYFNPGSAFDKSDGFKQNAAQLIGSMKVTF